MNKKLAIEILNQISNSPNLMLSKLDHHALDKAIKFIEEEFKKESIEVTDQMN